MKKLYQPGPEGRAKMQRAERRAHWFSTIAILYIGYVQFNNLWSSRNEGGAIVWATFVFLMLMISFILIGAFFEAHHPGMTDEELREMRRGAAARNAAMAAREKYLNS